MSEKIVVVALGHRALGTTLPEQKVATKAAAKAIADLVEEGAKVVFSHSNGPQIGMIHTAMNGIWKDTPGLYIRSYVSLLRNEPGLHWI